ncbi:MAG: dihydrolipoyl dehydrogenase [Terrisporobacter othiniensis]|uniref:dihydrolipoyl dehydrogenase n=1 Tax=Terrisporobacter petrolearius TaxID=1460447 RepID=UPI0022E7F0C3|nr:dihydrolipoyl dehydrogenase [Terrisporobacter petrolearius]MDU4861894.1 dihydrolipoyl dehydrogenase [Terrisporobacter othiniensis]MDU6995809.1 dihydrolipoyl dehydrogenase [Terrisporobacter othiniensis]
MKVAVVGGGPGGYVAALKAAMLGAEVTVIEKSRLGGTCLNVGCIPTKALLASSDVLRTVKEAKSFGINVEGEVKPDFQAIVARKQKITDELVAGIQFLFDKRGVKKIDGFGKLIDKNTIEVTKDDGSVEEVKADKIILANGSIPTVFPFMPYNGKNVITSDEVLSLEKLPKSMVIIGGGVIGSEIGQFYSSLGTKVTIIEVLPQILGRMDSDGAKALARQFKKDKIKVMCNVATDSFEVSDDIVKLNLNNGKSLEAEVVLLCTGRKPNLANSGVAEAGVKMTDRGFIEVNEYMETNLEGVYAIGDIIPGAMLAHVASTEGMVAAENAVKGNGETVNYKSIPSCVYTEPEVAGVGKTEDELKAEGVEYHVGKFDFRGLGKAKAIGKIQGFIKILVDKDDVIIGATLVGPHCTDLLTELSLAVGLGLKAKDVGKVIHAHPSLSEGIMEALHDVHGECVHSVPSSL